MNKWYRQLRAVPLFLAVALAFSMMAMDLTYAQPGMGPRGANLTPEQAQKIYDLRQKFMKETEDLRQQMFTKRNELNSLWAVENPDEKQIQAKQKEINAIREKIQAIAVSYQAQARKIAPNAYFGWGKGMGKGMGGGPWSMW
jgi:Spy/CpxP family protein refolding chaperone